MAAGIAFVYLRIAQTTPPRRTNANKQHDQDSHSASWLPTETFVLPLRCPQEDRKVRASNRFLLEVLSAALALYFNPAVWARARDCLSTHASQFGAMLEEFTLRRLGC